MKKRRQNDNPGDTRFRLRVWDTDKQVWRGKGGTYITADSARMAAADMQEGRPHRKWQLLQATYEVVDEVDLLR